MGLLRLRLISRPCEFDIKPYGRKAAIGFLIRLVRDIDHQRASRIRNVEH